MSTLFDSSASLFIVYGAVVIAVGPDILREIRHRRSDTETAKIRDEGSKQLIGAAGGSGILAGAAAVQHLAAPVHGGGGAARLRDGPRRAAGHADAARVGGVAGVQAVARGDRQ